MTKRISPRIILYLNAFPKLSETFIVNKFLGLLEKGWDVHIVCAESDAQEWKNFPELEKYPDVRRRVHVVWMRRPLWLAAALIPIALLRCLFLSPGTTFRYLLYGWKIFGFDILRRLYLDAEIIVLRPRLVHFEFGALAVGRMYLKKLLGCKALVSFRGYDLNFSGLDDPNYYADVWNESDALHVLGQDLWRRAIARGCPPDKPHAVIPPALDASKFTPAVKIQGGDPQKPLEILSVGRLEWKKGYEYALQSICLLRNAEMDCRLRIIGDGGYLEALAFARHQLKLTERVEFLGALSHEQTINYMRESDIFLHASLSEGFCNAVQEAQAMQIPVVCSDAGGLSENVEDGETGFVVPRRDAHALAEKIMLLARDPELRRKMGEAGRRRIQEHFQIGDQIRRFEEIYCQLLGVA